MGRGAESAGRIGEKLMYRIITVAREHGSGGRAIAKRIAERLNWRLLDKNIIAAIARPQLDVDTVCRCDRSVNSWWHLITRGGRWSAALIVEAHPAHPQFPDTGRMAALAKKFISDAATKGDCVIVGRGAQCVLQSCSEAFHVFIHAPWKARVHRVAQQVHVPSEVGELVQSADGARANYVQRYFGRDWKDPDLYHLMINSQLGQEEVATLIIDAVVRREMAAVRSLPDGELSAADMAQRCASRWPLGFNSHRSPPL